MNKIHQGIKKLGLDRVRSCLLTSSLSDFPSSRRQGIVPEKPSHCHGYDATFVSFHHTFQVVFLILLQNILCHCSILTSSTCMIVVGIIHYHMCAATQPKLMVFLIIIVVLGANIRVINYTRTQQSTVQVSFSSGAHSSHCFDGLQFKFKRTRDLIGQQ